MKITATNGNTKRCGDWVNIYHRTVGRPKNGTWVVISTSGNKPFEQRLFLPQRFDQPQGAVEYCRSSKWPASALFKQFQIVVQWEELRRFTAANDFRVAVLQSQARREGTGRLDMNIQWQQFERLRDQRTAHFAGAST